jgi:hypothetical protein
MKRAFGAYLASIELSQKAFRTRVDYAVRRIETVAGEPIDEILVEDLITQEGAREYLHLIAFSKTFIATMNDFKTENTVSLYVLRENIPTLAVETIDYEFGNPTTTSRIFVEFTLGVDDEWTLQGTRENCEAIWKAVEMRLRPNLAAST